VIGYLRGQILENSDGKVILTVATGSEAGAVGYCVSIAQGPSTVDWLPGKQVEVFVHTHVREDALDLYGFASRTEKEIFLTLLSVNGIGPKGAMGILSKVDPGTLIQAILDGDKDTLVKIQGVGKKTAERVVLELADPVRKKLEAGLFRDIRRPQIAAAAPAAPRSGGETGVIRDAKEALIGLGYREHEVGALLKKVLDEETAPPRRAEDLVRSALQRLS
jgi:Holliday junction DNA helicase RuvA